MLVSAITINANWCYLTLDEPVILSRAPGLYLTHRHPRLCQVQTVRWHAATRGGAVACVDILYILNRYYVDIF